MIKTKRNKKAVSLMLSYVLLIIIAISVSIGVYIWLKKIANVEPTPTCPDDASLMIQDYSCNSVEKTISIVIKNNGFFDIEGYDIRGTNETEGKAIFPLTDNSGLVENGRYIFEISIGKNTLEPNGEDIHDFSYSHLNSLKKIEIMPFKIKNGYIILCKQAKIIQEVDC